MKLGYLTAFSEEELKIASSIGFDGLELDAGSWTDDQLSPSAVKETAKKAKDLADKYGITITAIALYQAGLHPAQARIDAFKRVGDLCSEMGVGVIATLTGGDPDKNAADNIPLFKETFAPIAKMAENKGLKIAFENWAGFWGRPPIKCINFGNGPYAWDMMFDAVDSPALGLEFDPSHFVWQWMDYIAIAKMYGEKIFHVHLKDTEILEGKLSEVGAYGDGWWRYRVPGYGIINWQDFISTLTELGFDGGCAIEHEDPIFSGPRRVQGLKLGHNHLRPIIVRE